VGGDWGDFSTGAAGPALTCLVHRILSPTVLWGLYCVRTGDRLCELDDKLSDERLVQAARERQRRRFEGTGLMSNADMGPAEVRDHCQVDEAGIVSPWRADTPAGVCVLVGRSRLLELADILLHNVESSRLWFVWRGRKDG
jgi:hypothetical protein